MPDKYLTSYAHSAKLFKEGIELLAEFDKEGYEFKGLKVPLNYKDWVLKDFVAYASHPEGYRGIGDVIEICRGAGEREDVKDANGKTIIENGKPKRAYTEDAKRAQAALKTILPDCCPTWQQFHELMRMVNDKTDAVRTELEAKYPIGTLPPPAVPKATAVPKDKSKSKGTDTKPGASKGTGALLKDLSSDIAHIPTEVGPQEYNAQVELQRLKDREVVVSSNQSYQVPEFKDIAAKAVKGLNIRIG